MSKLAAEAGFWAALSLVMVVTGEAALAGPSNLRLGPEPGTMVQRVAVFGKDERTAVPQQFSTVRRAIGVLYNERAKTVCTAFCVGPKLIATAAHCLYRTAGDKPPDANEFVFTPGYESSAGDRRREPVRIAGWQSRMAAQNVLAGNTQIHVRPPIDAASDWALVRLATPACRNGILAVRTKSIEEIARAAQAKRLFQLSYHRDYKNWQLAYSKPCQAGLQFGGVPWSSITRDFSSARSLILHHCATGGASSGSPLLVDEPGGPYVVGINVGTYVLSKASASDNRTGTAPVQEQIANTGVNASAFEPLMTPFAAAKILESSDTIRALQTRLRELGFYQGLIDGGFGPRLRAAIRQFEQSRGLPVLGLATEAVLARAQAEPALTGPPSSYPNGIHQPTNADGDRPR